MSDADWLAVFHSTPLEPPLSRGDNVFASGLAKYITISGS